MAKVFGAASRTFLVELFNVLSNKICPFVVSEQKTIPKVINIYRFIF